METTLKELHATGIKFRLFDETANLKILIATCNFDFRHEIFLSRVISASLIQFGAV